MKDKNLEQQLADKLGNRSITPSDQAWERIARNRQQGKQKQTNKKRMFAYYAAACLLLMFCGAYFLVSNTNEEIVTQPQVVISDSHEKGDAVVEESFASPETVAVSGQPIRPVAYNGNEAQADLDPVNKKEVAIAIQSYSQPQPYGNGQQLAVAVLPQVKTVTKDRLYDEEVDYLLKNAIKEVAADKQFSKTTDNTALLKEVEAEMDEYYRDKAMSIFALKNKKIRFAVKE
ncbi:MAG: hypothetical protein DI539_23260 [Flavobacterium psychrophilum]|nr:MAG: hypothetical protein DI539_23260 [Flavobacterium psychrophilum]